MVLTAASDQVVYQDDYHHHYQDVNQIPTEVADESQQPQDQQYDQDCPKHYATLLFVQFALSSKAVYLACDDNLIVD